MSDKLIRREGAIVPADDFAEKIEDALKSEPARSEPKQRRVKPEAECPFAFKFEDNAVSRCTKSPGHDGQHQNGMLFWDERCGSVSRQGTQCRYQRDHIGAHVDGEQLVWAQSVPAIVDVDVDPSFGLLGEMLRDSPMLQELLKRRAESGAPLVQRMSPKKARDYVIALGPLNLDPGKSGTVSCSPQCLFRGEKLIIAGNPSAFVIENLFVGQRSQFPPGAGISGAVFSANRVDNEMRLDTCEPALSIAIAVRNVSSEKQVFVCNIIGKAVV